MRVSLTIEDDRENLDTIIKVVESLRVPFTVATKETVGQAVQNFAPAEPVALQQPLEQPLQQPLQQPLAAQGGNGHAPPKQRRGRPPKMARKEPEPVQEEPVKAEPAREVHPVEAVINNVIPHPASGNGAPDNATLLRIVSNFCQDHPTLNNAVKSLLAEYHVDAVTAVPVSRREEFLAQMDNLRPPASMLR